MIVRTVQGDVAPGSLGPADYHEHFFHTTALLPGEDLDDEERALAEARLVHAAGLRTVVDATPIGIGRRPAALARVALGSGLTIVAATGAHREAHYPSGHWLRELDAGALAALFVRDLTEGMPAQDEPGSPSAAATDVRAGFIKTGIGYWSVSAFESTVLEAAAQAHHRTGAAVMVHLEHGSAAHEVLDRLAALGVAPSRVILAHMDRSPDRILFAELASRGAFLGCDGAARLKEWPEAMLIDAIGAAIAAGAGDRILIGGDVARRSRFTSYAGMPGMAYLPRRFLPRLRQVIGDDAADRLLVANPAAAFTMNDAPESTGTDPERYA
ncbi:phosphotriesterase family protein [Sediminivirga luteola]|jgi:phosphotriesterase-related protein|uniref:phosphotriesterase family protein n=1 Tax=Sediminivirga luteola TaxID=1774748 RepID=UPI001F5821A9|nr:aryldialkylphosphatase [Sediminivirga luteola]MCI2264968.1 aryldialkylphosphatase [Sediminivirga luteola]